MNVTRALLLHLFARGNYPARSLRVRAVLYALGLFLIGLVSYRFAPRGYVGLLQLSPSQQVALLAAALQACTCILFVLFNGQQQSLLLRLRVVHLLALPQRTTRRLYGLAFIPLASLAVGLLVPGMASAFSGTLALGLYLPVSLGVCGVGVLYNMALQTKNRRGRQGWGAVGIVVGLSLSWSLATYPSAEWLSRVVAFGLMAQLIAAVCLLWGPITPTTGNEARRVRERKHLGIARACMVRACRDTRFRGANAVVWSALVILSVVAWYKPNILPFDAVAVLVLLLAGTLGLEVRGLSHRIYPIELVWYAQFRRWVLAGWLLAFLNILLITLVLAVLGLLYFSDSLSVGYGHVVGAGFCLASVGVLAGALVAPSRSDLLAQLSGAGLYAVFAWLTFRLLADVGPGQAIIAIGAASLSLAYVIERRRWLVTIRRKHGSNIF